MTISRANVSCLALVVLILFGFLATGQAVAGERSGSAAQRRIVLRKGDIEIQGCMRKSSIDPKVCLWGMHQLPGCTGECGEAVLPGGAAIVSHCGYSVAGVVVDAQEGTPRVAFPVDFILAGRERYRGKTDPEGRFVIEVPARGKGPECLESRDFGKMSVAEDTRKIVVLGVLSAQFHSAHPSLKLRFRKASEIAAEGIDIVP